MNYQIRTLVRKGDDHPVWCQDNFAVYDYTDSKFLITGIFDGCSTGKDSQFAAQLCGKIFKQTGAYINGQYNIPLIAGAKLFIWEFIKRLKRVKQDLWLLADELRSTCIFHFYDYAENKSFIACLGDGCVNINGELNNIDSDNKVNYPIDYPDEYFENALPTAFATVWLDDQYKYFIVENPKDISICSDGISSFTNHKLEKPDYNVPVNFLLNDMKYFNRKDNMLANKHQILKQEGWVNKDDLSIVRIVFQPN